MMNKKEKQQFSELLYRYGSQSLAFVALLKVLNERMPDLQETLVATLEKMEYPHLTGHAMIDEAIDFVRDSM